MFVAAVIISFVLGIVLTLLAQFVIARRWLTYLPKLYPPYKQQYEKFRLPPVSYRAFFFTMKLSSTNPEFSRQREKGPK